MYTEYIDNCEVVKLLNDIYGEIYNCDSFGIYIEKSDDDSNEK